MTRMIDSARTQYRAMFRSMAAGGRWHLHRIPDTDRVCLMNQDARWDIPEPPVLVPDVQAMTEARLVQKIHDAVRLGAHT